MCYLSYSLVLPGNVGQKIITIKTTTTTKTLKTKFCELITANDPVHIFVFTKTQKFDT